MDEEATQSIILEPSEQTVDTDVDFQFDLTSGNMDEEAMQSIILDLTRRLQNAQHTIDAQKAIAKESSQQAENYKKKMIDIQIAYRLEAAKSAYFERKRIQQTESKRYEDGKLTLAKMHQDLRIQLVDQQMSKSKLQMVKVQNLKEKIVKFTKSQESQKQLLQRMSEDEARVEELCRAAQQGNIEFCKKLLDSGVAVNDVDAAGFLAIHYACGSGHAEAVKLLLEYGSDPSSYITGKNPVEVACRYGHSHIIRLVVDQGGSISDGGTAGTPPIVTAAACGHVNCVEELYNLGANIEATDAVYNTALHRAVQLEDPAPMIQLLIRLGANQLAKNRDRLTPILLAYTLVASKAMEALGGIQSDSAEKLLAAIKAERHSLSANRSGDTDLNTND